MNSTNELYHYGVLGMKWGVHRAKRYADKAAYARRIGLRQTAKKYEKKSKAITAKHKKLAGKAYDYTKSQSLGKTVAKSLLMGTYGTLKYNQAKARGASRGRAAVEGLLYGYGNMLTGGVASIVEPRVRANLLEESRS